MVAIYIKKVDSIKKILVFSEMEKERHIIFTGKNGSGKSQILKMLKRYLQEYLYRRYQNMKRIEEYIAKKYGISVEAENGKARLQNDMKSCFLMRYYDANRTIDKTNTWEKLKKHLLTLKFREMYFRHIGKKEKADTAIQSFRLFERILQYLLDDSQIKLLFDMKSLSFSIVQGAGKRYSMDAISNGYKGILYIIIDLFVQVEWKSDKLEKMEGVVMIDEIDVHLHLELQKRVLPFLIGCFPRFQFIITTHSPFVLSSIENAVIYDLGNQTIIEGDKGLSNVPYNGILEGYFYVSALSNALKDKYEEYKNLARKKCLQDEDYRKLAALEMYLDQIPDYLALDIMTDYQKLKLELMLREEPYSL